MIRKMLLHLLMVFAFLSFISFQVAATCESDCYGQVNYCYAQAANANNMCHVQCPSSPPDPNCMFYCIFYTGYSEVQCALICSPIETCYDNCDNAYYQTIAGCQSTLPSCLAACNQCGNGTCGSGETFSNCSADCYCDNDGVCESLHGETHANCPNDCPCDNDGVCEPSQNENGSNCSDCYCDNDGVCEASQGEGSVVSCNDCITTCEATCQAYANQCAQTVQSCVDSCYGNQSCINNCGIIAVQCMVGYDNCLASCN